MFDCSTDSTDPAVSVIDEQILNYNNHQLKQHNKYNWIILISMILGLLDELAQDQLMVMHVQPRRKCNRKTIAIAKTQASKKRYLMNTIWIKRSW